MRFFNLDCHIAPIADLQNIFSELGHTVDSWSLSAHRWIFDLPACPSPVVTAENYRDINPEMVESFYRHHHKQLEGYDGFIACYPTIFLKLFERFAKPIIVLAVTRYDYPVQNDPARLVWLHDSLQNNPHVIRIANNQFDQQYAQQFTSVEWRWIPSRCAYITDHYQPSRKESVVYGRNDNLIQDSRLVPRRSLGRYSFQELFSFKSIIHYPYNVSTMSAFEQAFAGMPLFFPSLAYALKLLQAGIP